MTGKSTRLAGLNAPSMTGLKKRAFMACERCKLKKVKCDGSSPCQRCKADDSICLFNKNSLRGTRDVPAGYVQFLETRYQLLAQGLRKSYELLVSTSILPATSMEVSVPSSPCHMSEGTDSSQPSIQNILLQLGVFTSEEYVDQAQDLADCQHEDLRDGSDLCTDTHFRDAWSISGAHLSESPTSTESTPLEDVLTLPTDDTSAVSHVLKPPNPFKLADMSASNNLNVWEACGGAFDFRSVLEPGKSGMNSGSIAAWNGSVSDTSLQDLLGWDVMATDTRYDNGALFALE